jgi:ketosteroid isomerase-like protein
VSASNVEIIRECYEAAGRGDGETMLALLAPDVRWTEMAGFPYAGTYTGPGEVATKVLARIPEDWDDFRIDVDELLDAGDTVVMVGAYGGTSRATGKPMSPRVVHVWKLRGSKVTAFEQFVDTLKVAEALGA